MLAHHIMYSVEIQARGLRFTAKKDETVLQAALRNGFKFPYACDNGACYACEGKLIDGTVQYKNTHQIISAPKEGHQDSSNVLFCLAKPKSNLIIEVEKVLAPNEMPVRKAKCQIQSITQASHDVKCVKLLLPAGKKFDYLPGQYLEIILDENGKSAFSIANAPGSREIELHIRHTPDGASSDEIDRLLNNNSLLNIEIPKGDCILKPENSNHLIFIAGSTGFAPFKAMLESSFKNNRQQKMSLYWGGRTPEDIYLHELLTDWNTTYENFNYIPVVSKPDSQKTWTGRTGLVHEAALEDFQDFSKGIEIYIGGSPAMVYAGFDAFKSRGLPEDQIYSDVFSYAPRPSEGQ